MKTFAAPLLAVTAAVLAACAPTTGGPGDPSDPADAPIRAELWAVVTGAESLTVRRIHPIDARYLDATGEDLSYDSTFHGYPELASTVLTDAAALAELRRTLRAGIEGNDDMVAACFNPRHGITAEVGDRRVDLLICFECLQIAVHDETGERVESALTTEAPAEVFNRLFTEAGI